MPKSNDIMSADASSDARKIGDTLRHAVIQCFKVVLLGDPRVGKTSLVKALKNSAHSWDLPKEYKPTIGAWITHFDLTDTRRLLITDASGMRQEFSHLINLYLRNLHCVVFVFALDEPASFRGLSHWYDVFTRSYTGDASQVAKFVVGTKIDVVHGICELQREGTTFAKNIGAEMWITSAHKSFNTLELFSRIADKVNKQPDKELVLLQSDLQDDNFADSNASMLDDVLLSTGALVRYPDPILLDTEGEEISEILLSYQCVTMTGQKRTFKWGTWSKISSKEAVIRQSSRTPRPSRNKLWSSVMATAPSSTWQHENLEGVMKYGTVIRRQPTKTEFKSVKKMIFTSGDQFGWERNYGLFYMLLQNEDRVSEVGLMSASEKMCKTTASQRVVVQRSFQLQPSQIAEQVISVDMSCSHAVALEGEKHMVSTWGHVDSGALGLTQQDISIPTPLASINCQIKQVACGAEFTLMLTVEGEVFSWGKGAFGKLGHGDEEDRQLPTLITTLKNMEAIAARGDHAAAIMNGGYLYQWGVECADPQLTQFAASPKKVGQISSITVRSISCGTHHTVITGDGRFLYSGIPYAWGRGSHGRLGVGHCQNLFAPVCINALYNSSNVVTQVSAGDKHTAFLTKDGEVYTCGSNAFGQLGYFTNSGYSDIPRKVYLGKNDAGSEIRAEQICCNENYTMVLTQDADVIVWGKCHYGQKLENAIPLKDISIRDVTTCIVLLKNSFVELTVALTFHSELLICAGVHFDFDCQAADDTIPLITCNKANLITLSSVESVLVSVDEEGKIFYADLGLWVYQLLPQGQNTPSEKLIHALFQNMKEHTEPPSLPALEFVPIPSFCGGVIAVEATLSTFLFCSSIGDVYSWSPGGHVMHHMELNNEIIVQIACGASHCAALSTEGTLFTCGEGGSGQLGIGSFKSAQTFQLVPLTEFERVKNVCCGWASTSVVAENGKVYFWGQLDLSRGEKIKRKLSPTKPFNLATPTKQQENRPVAPVGYEVKLTGDAGVAGHHLALVGQPLTVEIIQRAGNSGGGLCEEFRAETSVASHDARKIHSKGAIKRSHTTDGAFVASVVFYSEGVFNVFLTRNGQNILGSPLKVIAENGAVLKRTKVSLVGSNIECLREVGGVLQQAIAARDPGIELWGVPSVTTDLQTQEAFQMASVTNGGIYVYVWEGNLSEENLSLWLHQLFLSAPSSNVILLGVNISATYANEIDLKPFQKINPRLKRCIFAGTTFASEHRELLDEIFLLVKHSTIYQRLVSNRFERLVEKVAEKKKSGVETLDETSIKCLAAECGIQREPFSREAAEQLEAIGMGLLIREESFFLVLQPFWLSRHLSEMAKSSHLGSLERDHLETAKQHVANLLISKGLALERMNKSEIDIVPYLCSIPEESWSLVEKSTYTLYRHLIINAPPYVLHSVFQTVTASVLQEFSRVSLGRYSLVIHNDQHQSRIDCGPCVTNRTVTEIRVTVRASSQDTCCSGADAIGSFLQRCCETLGLSGGTNIKASCSVCHQFYIDLADIKEMLLQGDAHLSCGRCHGSVPVSELLNGFIETRAALEMNWKPFHGLQGAESPSTTRGVPSDTLLRPLMRYLGDREEKHEAKLLKEIRGMFENMSRVFADMKNYDVPRTICILPEFQRSSLLKSNAVKMLLMYGKPKYRLFLLCEGNGDGTGVHFLDYDKHQGYRLEESVGDCLFKENVSLLRLGLQLLLSGASVFNLGAGLGLLNVSEVLDVAGLSGGMISAVPWKKVFKEMDNFFKGVQESVNSIRHPKGLSELSVNAGIAGCQVGSEQYSYLRKLLSDLGPKDDFGGLHQEPRDGIGAIWVCDKHRMYAKDERFLKVMP